jgi:hypothetical protein
VRVPLVGVVGQVKKRSSKKKSSIGAADMKYQLLCCREAQGQFRHYWAARKANNGDTMVGDYVTKHHVLFPH